MRTMYYNNSGVVIVSLNHSGLNSSVEHELLVWRVSLTPAHILAIISFVYRIYRRRSIGQTWWDDHVAAFCLFLECLYFPTLWLRATVDRETLIATTWIIQAIFPLLIWFTRVSLALSVSRFIPPKQKMRRTSISSAVIFGVAGFSVCIANLVKCKRDAGNWEEIYPYQCPLSTFGAIFRICMDILADIALVIIPLFAFWRRLKLSQTKRRLIKACFAASLLTFIVNIIVSGALFGKYNSRNEEKKAETAYFASVMSQLLAIIALLVCNGLVVATSFYRFFHGAEIAVQRAQNPSPPDAQPSNSEAESSPANAMSLDNHSGGTISALARLTHAASSAIELTELFDSDFTDHDQQASENIDTCNESTAENKA